MRTWKTRWIGWIFGGTALASGLAGGCGGKAGPKEGPKEESSGTSQSLGIAATPALDTFIPQLLQVDQISSGLLDPADGDLFTHDDPSDCTGPTCTPPLSLTCPGDYTDWNEIGTANHQLTDTNGKDHKDGSSFPGSDECVGSSVVVAKMDLVYAGVASNNQFVYTATTRSKNDGDAGYYWLFTKKAPRLMAKSDETATCKFTCSEAKGEKRLVYDITGPSAGGAGDVLFAGHFHPNGAPFLRVFRPTASQDCVSAVDALDFTNARWCEAGTAGCGAGGVSAVAVNTTPTDPGVFGSAGVDSLVSVNPSCGGSTTTRALDTELFAETAVPLSVFTGGGTSCGATYYGSIITRSSGAGGKNPDLKDLIGPALFNFGNVSASTTLTGGCANSFTYSATLTGATGTPTCTWTFKNAQGTTIGTSTTCSGTQAATGAEGGAAYTADLVITDPAPGGTGCGDTKEGIPVTVYSGISVDIAPSAQSAVCSGDPPSLASDALTYTATVSGGSGSHTLAWTIDGSSASGCSGTTCEVNPPDGTFCASHDIYVTATDTGNVGCTNAQSETEQYLKQTSVSSTDKP